MNNVYLRFVCDGCAKEKYIKVEIAPSRRISEWGNFPSDWQKITIDCSNKKLDRWISSNIDLCDECWPKHVPLLCGWADAVLDPSREEELTDTA